MLFWILLHTVYHMPWPWEGTHLLPHFQLIIFSLAFAFCLPGSLQLMTALKVLVYDCLVSLRVSGEAYLSKGFSKALVIFSWTWECDFISKSYNPPPPPTHPKKNPSTTNQLKKGLSDHYLYTDWHQLFHTDNDFHGNFGHINSGSRLETIFGTSKNFWGVA